MEPISKKKALLSNYGIYCLKLLTTLLTFSFLSNIQSWEPF